MFIEKIIDLIKENNYSLLGLDFSPIRGPEGNIEYLAHLQKTDEIGTIADVAIDWKLVVENAFETLAK